MYLSPSLNTPSLSSSVVKEPAPLCISPFLAGRLLNCVRGRGAGAGWTMQRRGFWVCLFWYLSASLSACSMAAKEMPTAPMMGLPDSKFVPRQESWLSVSSVDCGPVLTGWHPVGRVHTCSKRVQNGQQGLRGRQRERERITLGVFRHETEGHQGMDLELVWSWICEFEFTSVELMWARSPRISTIVSNAVMDVRVQVSLWDPGFNPFKYIPGCGIAGSW